MSTISVRLIAETVAEFYGVSYRDLVSHRRSHDIIKPRHVACWLARHHTPHTMGELGRCFGGRDHTTILHAVSAINEQMTADAEFAAEVQSVESAVEIAKRSLTLLRVAPPADIDAVEVAERILDGNARVVVVSLDELRALAAAALSARAATTLSAEGEVAVAATRFIGAREALQRFPAGETGESRRRIVAESAFHELRRAVRALETSGQVASPATIDNPILERESNVNHG